MLIPLALDGVPQLILLAGDSRFVLLFGLIPENSIKIYIHSKFQLLMDCAMGKDVFRANNT